MDNKFQLFHLYNKKILSSSGFRLYVFLLHIQNAQVHPSPIKASRGLLSGFTGLSENSLKAAITELLDLKLVVLKSERPSLWEINTPENFNHQRLAQLLAGRTDAATPEADSADSDAK